MHGSGHVQMLEQSTTIKISRFSFELFMNFLQRNQVWSMLSVCNEYLTFDIQPRIQNQHQPLEALLLKDTGDEGLRINRREVGLGHLRGGLEDLLVSRAMDALLQVWH
jgi:hypothetical protein